VVVILRPFTIAGILTTAYMKLLMLFLAYLTDSRLGLSERSKSVLRKRLLETMIATSSVGMRETGYKVYQEPFQE
jgi:hypothetical protein